MLNLFMYKHAWCYEKYEYRDKQTDRQISLPKKHSFYHPIESTLDLYCHIDWLNHDCIEMASISAFHAVGSGFVSQLGHTKDHKNGTNYFPAWHSGIKVGVWQCDWIV